MLKLAAGCARSAVDSFDNLFNEDLVMSDFFVLFLYFVLFVSAISALIYDVINSNLGWAIIDFLIAPIGAIRGLALLFGYIS